jgi:hypothetical protein
MKSVGQRRVIMDVRTRIDIFADAEYEGTAVLKYWEVLAHYHTTDIPEDLNLQVLPM